MLLQPESQKFCNLTESSKKPKIFLKNVFSELMSEDVSSPRSRTQTWDLDSVLQVCTVATNLSWIKSNPIRVVKADFLKAVREAVAQRLIKAVKRLLYSVNKTNDCFKMRLTLVRLRHQIFTTEKPVHHGFNRRFA